MEIADVWPNAKPSTIDFDEFVEINEFFIWSLSVTFIKLEFIGNLFRNLLEKLFREWKLFTPTSLEFYRYLISERQTSMYLIFKKKWNFVW